MSTEEIIKNAIKNKEKDLEYVKNEIASLKIQLSQKMVYEEFILSNKFQLENDLVTIQLSRKKMVIK